MTTLNVVNDVLASANRAAGLDISTVDLIRDGSNIMCRLPGDVVARIGRPGTQQVADREVRVSRWLTRSGLRVVQALDNVPQPVVVDDRPVTWWRLIPEHRHGTPGELASILRVLHGLPVPSELALPLFDPFISLDSRISETHGLNDADRTWLRQHLARLREKYRRLPAEGDNNVIHGDAWQGNVAVPKTGLPILLDFEMVSIGRTDWDLVQVAVDYADFARLTADDYHSFVDSYGGYDVISTPGFRTASRKRAWPPQRKLNTGLPVSAVRYRGHGLGTPSRHSRDGTMPIDENVSRRVPDTCRPAGHAVLWHPT